MPVTAVSKKPSRTIARPLKVLTALIKTEINLALTAGIEHYLNAGELMIETQESGQIPKGSWGGWLSENFRWSDRTARRWMAAARRREEIDENDPENIEEFLADGDVLDPVSAKTAKKRRDKAKALMDLINAFDAEAMALERQSIDEEVRLHREIAVQLIDLGYRAMAMRLHPDKGGSPEAMIRLTKVRDELKPIAAKRRYV